MVRKLFSSMLSTLLLLAFIVMAVAVVISKASGGTPNFFGYQIKTVLSGSMEPGIQTGSIIAVKPGGDMTRFSPGDVISFKSGDKIITHRIVDVTQNGSLNQVMYKTKGDNNDAPDLDAVPSGDVIGEYSGFTLPYAGYAMTFANSKAGSLLLLVVPGLLLFAFSLFSSWKVISRLEKKEGTSTGSDTGTGSGPAPKSLS
ncbi:signal peptidase I SipW [Paenibacillus physcomitrellae]|uniref:Signal peptidase I n=1 Tax=Paenibacillus physcomitrellae TaxID=1619311 RepID=A0ABQ1G1R0_9BACL|nr:signal peptidase I [Paenibacillus physcomitrellae]GGA35408.1 S26 family signal peptidase [Paenibacillus physcomitrellae]